ncbi:MAG TPA: hypothetical protein VGK87_08500 [Anaerolineae bacterium]
MTQESFDIDALMCEALDGTISMNNRLALHAALERYPDKKAIFEQMRAFDGQMRAEHVPATPSALTGRIMDAVSRSHLQQPALRAPQIVFLIAFPALMCALIAAGTFILFSFISIIFPQDLAQLLLALLSGLADVLVSIVATIVQVNHALMVQPLTWVGVLGGMGIIAIWLRLLVPIWIVAKPRAI